MKLLRASFSIKFQESIIYRENIIINFMFGLIPLVINILLWQAIYGGQGKIIAGYTYVQMITYFTLVFFIQKLTSSRQIAVNLAEYIQEGTLNNFLLKPIDFVLYQFKIHFAEKIILLLNILVPFCGFAVLMRNYLYFNYKYLAIFIVSVFFSFVLNYLIYFILGILTIWLEEISALLDLWDNIVAFLAGGIFPLALLPDSFFKIVSLLPFKYMVFMPIDIYMGTLVGKELIQNLLIQLVWMCILAVLLKIIWKKAIKAYSGYGS